MTEIEPSEFGLEDTRSEELTVYRVLMGVLPLFLLLGLGFVALLFKVFSPESDRRRPPSLPALSVEVLRIEPQNYQVMVESYGTVQPRTQSMLVAQVSGQIMSINPQLRQGGFFEEGDTLLTIDDRDYAANVEIAKATLIDAQQNLAEEEARSNQASADWARLGNQGSAPDLVLRKPQLSAAQARVASAQSQLDKTLLNMERTRITAPFAGRVLTKNVDVGQVVNPNSTLAQVYATDYVEVRLPLRDKDLGYVNLPEQYRSNGGVENTGPEVPVTLYSSLVDKQGWEGRIMRTESAIDTTARQLHCVAQIDDPFGEGAAGRTPLKIGEYVTAEIAGKELSDALVVPTSAIYQSTFAYVVEDELLQQRTVSIAWQNDTEAVIASGLQPGDLLITTPLGQVTSGSPVLINEDSAPPVPEKTTTASESSVQQGASNRGAGRGP